MSSRYSANDIYCYSNSLVLKNKLNLLEQEKLDAFEAECCSARMIELDEKPIQGQFDLTHLQEIHKALFQDVYDWAGEIRTVDISLGGNHFAHAQYINENAVKLFRELAKENFLKHLNVDDLAKRLAYYLSEINALHPFREGNGRAQRVFISQLSREAGHQIDYSDLDQTEVYDAMKEAFNGNEKLLAELIRKRLK
jgi:cell filamentation protein